MLYTIFWGLHGIGVILNFYTAMHSFLTSVRRPVRVVLMNAEDGAFVDGPVDCTICGESEGGDCVRINCGHAFHRACVKSWTKDKRVVATCPNCRAVIRAVGSVPLPVVIEHMGESLKKLVFLLFWSTLAVLLGSSVSVLQIVPLWINVYEAAQLHKNLEKVQKELAVQ